MKNSLYEQINPPLLEYIMTNLYKLLVLVHKFKNILRESVLLVASNHNGVYVKDPCIKKETNNVIGFRYLHIVPNIYYQL